MSTDALAPNHVDLIDGLRRFQNEFVRDFSHRDVLNELKNTIPREEFTKIRAESKNNEEFINRLFFFYIYSKKNVRVFIKILQDSYKWLYDSILGSKNDKSINEYRRAIQDIPNNRDWNVHRTKFLWELQENLKSLTRGKYLILFGKLGFGKKWLAADACRDYAVISRMGFKIYWLNVSKCSTYELILDKLHRLKVLLHDDDLDIKYSAYSGNAKNEIIHVRGHLRKVLEQPQFAKCLIVLTDVQDENIVKAFNLNCKMLLTTRYRETLEQAIATESRKIIDIDKGFTLDESQELFVRATQYDSTESMPRKLQLFIHDIHEKCAGHPFIMSLIAKTYQNARRESDDKIEKRCGNWRENIENYKLEDDCKKIQMSVNESLQLLEDAQHVEAYRKMVVFTDNIEVPLTVLSKLWGTDPQRTEDRIEKFHKYSLVERHGGVNETCVLHYVHNKYLKSEVPAEEQAKYHQLILDKYEVEEKFRHRDGLELNFPRDNYFHFFIGYHILGAKRFDLFDLYLDYGFLEEKIRIAKLPNLLGDFNKFSSEITQHEGSHEGLLRELEFFLRAIEKLLLQSRDITLLQYALTYEGQVKDAAMEQLEKFSDRVWFNDINHIVTDNQSVEIQASANPIIVRFAQPGDNPLCLIYLQDNNIILHDISPDYNIKPIPFRNEMPHEYIVEMQVFRNEAFLVLNDTGKLQYYNIKVHKTSPRRPSIIAPLTNASTKESSVDKTPYTIENRNDKFTCFYVIEQQIGTNVDLILGTSKGILKFYKWTNSGKFEDNKHEINSRLPNLFRIAVINDYAMLINLSGDVCFVNLIDESKMMFNIEIGRHERPLNLHQGTCLHTKLPITVLVTANKVLQINHKGKFNSSFLNLEKETIFMSSEEFDDFEILSSAMSKDSEYIILGTTNGIIVLDRFKKQIFCRRSIKDHVMSLDVHREVGEVGESIYILVSVFKESGKLVSLHGFTKDNCESFSMTQRDEIKFLSGEDLFDVRKCEKKWSLVATDSKRNIHLKSSTDDFNESTVIMPFQYQAKKICFINDRLVFCGCVNGVVCVVDLSMSTCDEVTKMTGEITYMENFGDTTIVSTNNSYKIITCVPPHDFKMQDQLGKATKAYKYNEDLLVVVMKDCSLEFIDTRSQEVIKHLILIREGSACVAVTFCDYTLAIATAENNIHLFELASNIDTSIQVKSIEGQLTNTISTIAISPEKSVLAVGCLNGSIELFDLNLLIPIRTLESHKRSIMSLQFSPWPENEGHLILLSLAESINFWNVTHILNNRTELKRVETRSTRLSQRFKSPLKTVTNGARLETAMQQLTLKERNWSNKMGAFNKRELLSCVKFIGKSAKKVVTNGDFTRFVTIDNEGNVYHLRLIEQSLDGDHQQVMNGIDMNGNLSHE